MITSRLTLSNFFQLIRKYIEFSILFPIYRSITQSPLENRNFKSKQGKTFPLMGFYWNGCGYTVLSITMSYLYCLQRFIFADVNVYLDMYFGRDTQCIFLQYLWYYIINRIYMHPYSIMSGIKHMSFFRNSF